MDANILVECYTDTILIETLVTPIKTRGYNHQKNCIKVLNVMKIQLANEFALGIIDDDKVKPKDFNVFILIKKHNKISIYKHENKSHYIIKISKAVENFILQTAQQCNISLSDYNLPTDLENLKKITKHATSKNNPDLRRLFMDLKQNANSDFFKLAQWIEQIKSNPYIQIDF
ncbi:MAG: hypothetical protein LBT27_06865 [Prevotellaceae bacterium]|jgi:hypothetical protein|nr:hypothetical protein [Prevotellaceae bacterium]